MSEKKKVAATWDPGTPGLATMVQTGHPQHVQVKFIRMDERGRMVVTQDGRSFSYANPASVTVHNPLRAPR